MDLTRLFRSESFDSTASTSTSTAPTSPTASPSPNPRQRLHVDTSIPNLAVARKAASFRVDRSNAAHAFWNAAPTPTPAPTPTASEPSPSPSPSPAPTPTHDVVTPLHHDAHPQRHIQRRRSHSECLLLAKNGVTDLPGPCQEYISSVKQILARSERSRGGMRSSPIAH